MNEKKTCYYAHCMALYNTPQERRDIVLLESLGFQVFNPNCSVVQNSYREFQAHTEVANHFQFWTGLARSCDLAAFRGLPDGRIPSGVWQEIAAVLESGKQVIELPSGFWGRGISVVETRAYLKEVGYR